MKLMTILMMEIYQKMKVKQAEELLFNALKEMI